MMVTLLRGVMLLIAPLVIFSSVAAQENTISVILINPNPDVLAQIEADLAQLNYQLEIVTEDENAVIRFAPVVAYVQLTTVPVLPSPILYAQEAHASAVFLDQGLRTITGLLLYSVGACDEALNFLPDGLYRGNCLLLTGDYTAAVNAYNDPIYPVATPRTINQRWTQIQITPAAIQRPLVLCPAILDIQTCTNQQRVDRLSRIAQLDALIFDYDLAISQMTTAIETAESHQFAPEALAELYTLRGQLKLLLYEWDNVLADYNHALEIAPDYADAYFYRGLLYYSALTDQIPREVALADFETYLVLAPDGLHAETAQQYITVIQAEMSALDS